MKKKEKKKKIDKELLNLILISILLFMFGLIIFKDNKFIFSVILGCVPYGYSLLDFFDEEKFKKFGKFSCVISCLVRIVLGTFIGVVALPIKIGFSIMENSSN